MYGTVARFQLKPGMESALQESMKPYESMNVPGFVSATVYRLDSGDDNYMMTVVFTDKASYVRNADSPDQDKRFQEFRALLTGDPEWSDGEVIYGGK